MTVVVNFVAAPNSGKSLTSALIFSELKMNHQKAEYIQEYAKFLIYSDRIDELNNQYQVSYEQYKMLKPMDGVVDYLVCDSPLLLGLYYNRIHPNNLCNVTKTEKLILDKIHEFHNVYIFLDKEDDIPYENEGRIHTEEESNQIQLELLDLLEEFNIPYLRAMSGKEDIDRIMEYIWTF